MISNKNSARKWQSLFPAFPAYLTYLPWIKLRLPLIAAVLLSAGWGSVMIRNELSLHNTLDGLTDNHANNPGPIEPTASAPVFNLAATTALNLFGNVEIKPAEMDIAALPSTTSNLKLVGLFASSRPGASRSLIAEQDKPAKSYSEGDALPGNATVFRIENDCVVVRRGDQYEKLSLPGSQLGKPAPTPLQSFAQLAQAQSKIAAAAPAPTISKHEADKSEGPQAIYHALEARLTAMSKLQKAKK